MCLLWLSTGYVLPSFNLPGGIDCSSVTVISLTGNAELLSMLFLTSLVRLLKLGYSTNPSSSTTYLLIDTCNTARVSHRKSAISASSASSSGSMACSSRMSISPSNFIITSLADACTKASCFDLLKLRSVGDICFTSEC